MPVAAASGVSKRFGPTRALSDVSLAVRPGEVHGLVGRNGAGKSTLVNIFTGLLGPDSGEVRFEGEAAPALTARDLWQQRVACVYQHPTVVPALNVAENLFLNAAPRNRAGIVDWGALRRRAREELEAWDIELELDREVGTLSVEQRQLVEIGRALRLGSRFIILDEPTAQLHGKEIRRLFERVGQLKQAGVAFLYISHHLEEIYELCDTVTVLRNGERVLSDTVDRAPRDRVVSAMVGGEMKALSRHRNGGPSTDGGSVLRVTDLEVAGRVRGVSLEVAAGECLGLAGQAAAGTGTVGDVIVGLLSPDSGVIEIAGRPLGEVDVANRIDAGVGYVPEDRHDRGLVPALSVEEHATMTILGRLSRAGVIKGGERRRRAKDLIAAFGIQASSPAQPVSELSGGNQQKTVMARCLASDPKVLVLNKPTAGVDIAAKEALYEVIRKACANGAAALLISDEVEELAICDRVLVMYRGSIRAEFSADRRDDDLVAAMEGVENHA
jgi:simple sugar transport system ATP-binding protein